MSGFYNRENYRKVRKDLSGYIRDPNNIRCLLYVEVDNFMMTEAEYAIFCNYCSGTPVLSLKDLAAKIQYSVAWISQIRRAMEKDIYRAAQNNPKEKSDEDPEFLLEVLEDTYSQDVLIALSKLMKEKYLEKFRKVEEVNNITVKMTDQQQEAFDQLIDAFLECERKGVHLVLNDKSLQGYNGDVIDYFVDDESDIENRTIVPVIPDKSHPKENSFAFFDPEFQAFGDYVVIRDVPEEYKIYSHGVSSNSELTLECTLSSLAEVREYLAKNYPDLWECPEVITSRLRYGQLQAGSFSFTKNSTVKVVQELR